MGKILKSDLIIGNFIINQVKNNRYDFIVSDIAKYNNILFDKLKKLDIYTNFSVRDIVDFQKRHFWFFDDDGNLEFNIELDQLIKYFQTGVLKTIVEVMEESYMELRKKTTLKICEDCIHKEVCKYEENIEEKELEEPLEINCKYKQLIFKYMPINYQTINQNPNITTSYNICKSCCYLVNNECKAPNNMAGLPCQNITCKS